jgi:hypothetical protein
MAYKTTQLSLLLSPREKAALAELAKRNEMSMGALIRKLIEDELRATELQGANA